MVTHKQEEVYIYIYIGEAIYTETEEEEEEEEVLLRRGALPHILVPLQA